MGEETLNQLQSWYANQCDGEWEHLFGITIQTLDNPGWDLTVDLCDTNLDGIADFFINEERNENDWYMTGVKNNKFFASGDLTKLDFIVKKFLEFAQTNS